MKKKHKISGKLEQPKQRIGVLYTRFEDSEKKKKHSKVRYKDLDKLLAWTDD